MGEETLFVDMEVDEKTSSDLHMCVVHATNQLQGLDCRVLGAT